MFEDEVEEMYQDIIKPIFNRQSLKLKNTIGDAFNTLKMLLMKID
jgi:hypothetical protein